MHLVVKCLNALLTCLFPASCPPPTSFFSGNLRNQAFCPIPFGCLLLHGIDSLVPLTLCICLLRLP